MTARTLLAPRVADRLAKLCGLFGSDHDGERANAARLADQLIREPGLTWPDVIISAGVNHNKCRLAGNGQLVPPALSAIQRERIEFHSGDADVARAKQKANPMAR